jgi:hypothetical protein
VLKARAANSQFMEGHPWTGVSRRQLLAVRVVAVKGFENLASSPSAFPRPSASVRHRRQTGWHNDDQKAGIKVGRGNFTLQLRLSKIALAGEFDAFDQIVR